MTAVAIIDSGGANIASLKYAFDRLHCEATLTTDKDLIRNAKRVLLPGVGAARDAMTRLEDADLVDLIRQLTQPVLGICLGMQLLYEHSEEEDVNCLGIIPGTARKLQAAESAPVPNMGWCATEFRGSQALFTGLKTGCFFYYLHSYAVPDADNALATASHGETRFSAVVKHKNFCAAQFHPERSSQAGARVLSNFVHGVS